MEKIDDQVGNLTVRGTKEKISYDTEDVSRNLPHGADPKSKSLFVPLIWKVFQKRPGHLIVQQVSLGFLLISSKLVGEGSRG